MSDIVLLKTGIELPMNAEMVYFNYFWLRDNCATSWDSSTQERTFDILDEADDLHATSAWINAASLEVIWSDGYQSRYNLDWLERWHKGENHGDLAVRARKTWYGDHYPNMARFSYDDVMANPASVADWAEAMLDEGVALIQDMPNSNEGLKTLCELFGTVRPSFSGYTFDVQSKANPENLAYTSKALELHTDLPAEELAPGIQFLHCRVNDAEGGNSLFVDATTVANALKQSYPQYFKILTEYQVPYRYTTHYQDVRTKQRIIELDPNNGEVSGINFSQHLADVFDFSQREMDTFYPAFRKFGQMLQDAQYLMTFRLNAGECMVFDNHRIAHGRASFIKGSGARHLRGCYVDRGDLRSVYRVLRASYPKAEAEVTAPL
ncbi:MULTISPECIES: TauD/TfdA family dioxygenase [unclassified Colwellia]|uniref:TauD/TfdA family dioxygenase n=1 Tax=unclassified Colwellia TaxID=196834 RepID=UPI0015F6AF67|nr:MULTISPECIES: TauD/TfdA family dioxygenase [unclassified Colwellia]MBA6288745.1 TauD/TfdA family dioxygenase [Colwellia sp. MB3u-4]MBA6297019.1 TauD/TfdA family dioxygenase [Colwellia sp. MB02u-9]